MNPDFTQYFQKGGKTMSIIIEKSPTALTKRSSATIECSENPESAKKSRYTPSTGALSSTNLPESAKTLSSAPRAGALTNLPCRQVQLMDLPVQVLLHILQYIPQYELHRNAALVSRHMFHLSRDPSLNRKIRISGSKLTTRATTKYLLKNWSRLKEIHVDQVTVSPNQIIQFLDKHIPSLEKLTISGPINNKNSIYPNCVNIKDVLPNLTELNILVPILLSEYGLQGDETQFFFENRPHIYRGLNFYCNSSIGFLDVIGKCPWLQCLIIEPYLDFVSMMKLTCLKHLTCLDVITYDIYQHEIVQMFQAFDWRELKALTYVGINTQFDDQCFHSLLQAAPNLQSLRLKCSSQYLSMDCFKNPETFYPLKQLSVPQNHGGLTDEFFSLAVNFFPKLEVLLTHYIQVNTLDHIIRACSERPELIIITACRIYHHIDMPLSKLSEVHNMDEHVTKVVLPSFSILADFFAVAPLAPRTIDPNAKNLLDLPNEILMKILAFLPITEIHLSVSMVCKKMLTLTQEPLFNRKVSIGSGPEMPKRATKPGLLHLKKHWNHLQELELKSLATPGSRSILGAAHTEATFGTLQLDKLVVSHCCIDNDVFEELSESMILPDLKELHLDYPDYHPDLLAKFLVHRGPIIHSLRLRFPKRILYKELWLEHLTECTNLRKLDLASMKLPSVYVVKLRCLDQLVELKVQLDCPSKELLLMTLSDAPWRRLRHLEFGNLRLFDDQCFKVLLAAAPNLEFLALMGCKRVTMDSFSNLNRAHVPNIKYFCLGDACLLNNSFFETIFNFFPHLKFVDVSGFHLASRTPLMKLVHDRPKALIVHNLICYHNNQLKVKDLQDMHKDYIPLSQYMKRFLIKKFVALGSSF